MALIDTAAGRKVMRTEAGPDRYLPYVRHVTANIVNLKTRAMMAVLKLDGVAFETADIGDMNALMRSLNVWWRNECDERLAAWVHVIRRKGGVYPAGAFATPFAALLDRQYKTRLLEEDLYTNDIYLTLLWHPPRNAVAQLSRFIDSIGRARREDTEAEPEAIKALRDRYAGAVVALERYSPTALGLYAHNGLLFSEVAEFLHLVLTGERQRMPLPRGPIGPALCTSRLIFGREVVEIRSADRTRYAALFGVKEYPATSRVGMFNGVLRAPFECILTQSIGWSARSDGIALFQQQARRMVSANDPAFEQVEDLRIAAGELQGGAFVTGEHHLSLLIYSDSIRSLQDSMARGRQILADAGLVVAREDRALESAYWAQMPGNFRERVRVGVITSKNFAAFAGFHSYPLGQPMGNQWGDAVTMLQTAAGGPFYFSFHAPRSDLGNTFLCGPSGSGKTVAQMVFLAQSGRLTGPGKDRDHSGPPPRLVIFDKDRGTEIAVRALGGAYLTLRNATPTGCAPLKVMEDTPEDRAFLAGLVRRMVYRPGQPLSAKEEAAIVEAVQHIMLLPPANRSFAGLRQFLGFGGELGQRFERWIRGGELGWALDGEADQMPMDARVLGFDMTELLDNADVRTAVMMYLFRRVEDLLDGQRIIIDIDEFWKVLGDPVFTAMVQDHLKTIRKKNGVLVFGTQSPRDALNSEIAHSIVEQCPTQIFFPNPRGDRDDYCDGFKLSDREYRLIREELTPESRQFLIRQGHNSVVVGLNLRGMTGLLDVLSGRTQLIEEVDQLRRIHGDHPDAWLPLYLAAR